MSNKDQNQVNSINPDDGKINPRSVYSMDEIKNILSGLDSALSDHKAKMQGIDPENMVKTIRGGRVVWITKEEMNAILKKKKQILKQQTKTNPVSKQDTVSSEINHRILICKSIISIVRRIAKDQAAHLVKQFRKIEYYQNLSISRSNDIRLIESAIQQKKQQDPVLQDAEAANQRLLDAVKSLDTAEIEIQQSYRERHMDDFFYKEQRLEPYYRKVKEYREEFIVAKHQLCKRQFHLIYECLQIIKPFLNDLIYHDTQATSSSQIIAKYKELSRKVQLSYDQGCVFLTDQDQKEIDIKELQKWDQSNLLPLINQTIEFMSSLLNSWKQIVEKIEPRLVKSETKLVPQTNTKVSRMVFTNQTD